LGRWKEGGREKFRNGAKKGVLKEAFEVDLGSVCEGLFFKGEVKLFNEGGFMRGADGADDEALLFDGKGFEGGKKPGPVDLFDKRFSGQDGGGLDVGKAFEEFPLFFA
jgi:hypothetical protein